MGGIKFFVCAVFCLASFSGCFRGQSNAATGNAVSGQDAEMRGQSNAAEPDFQDDLRRILSDARLPPELVQELGAAAREGPSFILDLLAVLEGDPYLRILVDKAHALPGGYEPEDLVTLSGPSYRTGRNGLLLRQEAARALEEMAAAAAAEGLTLTASSTYRSYNYQVEVYARNVQEDGQEAADRVSARPGHSQHQLGLVVDFGSISDEFAGTREGRWLLSNAGRFGWSLSFPDGYEALTGYRWESWHYRYVGRDLVHFIDTYFNGIQQYALQFIHAWEEAAR
ncbi:MAG: M15 family metallopeptidase [Spirochaetaceae bacterium]|jgi:D-alanyl-D-alanine carboxypeptidase|nr:M15 family metallopeptidase [Spirochaetaceae bacterium]